MNNIELLSPVGDFECLKAAVQNGANSVYLGASLFSARAKAKNFDNEELKEAIIYAKSRNVEVHLTLNTLIKDTEFDDAVKLAVTAYNLGVDAIIIQDLGLAKYLIKNYPDIPLHASTQMTVHNLDGVKQLEKLGYKRVVLARELSIDEIEYIRKNTNIELEVFIHGALCISYSGQCLLSSMIGGRSGNRGLCAQPCRLKYELVEENTITKKTISLDKGYLMSPKDTLGIEMLPKLIKLGINSIKVEGRMKTPYYVATVTNIYRKYIDYIYDNINLDTETLIKNMQIMLNNKNEITSLSDKEELAQVFNRGGFSTGHFKKSPNHDLIYKEKSNNMGFYLGTISHINESKGHLSLKLENTLSIGDKVSINNESYNVSELMIDNNNYETLEKGTVCKIGRMKGDLSVGQKIYRIESAKLNKMISPSFKEDKNIRKVNIFGKIVLKYNKPIELTISSNEGYYKNIEYKVASSFLPDTAKSNPITIEKIEAQILKTGNTVFNFSKLDVDLEDNLFVPNSILNDIRRTALEGYLNLMLEKNIPNLTLKEISSSHDINNTFNEFENNESISLLLNVLNINFDYSKLNIEKIDCIYIPLKYFLNAKFEETINMFSNSKKVFIYLPHINKDHLLSNIDFDNILNKYKISGFVISHISQLETLNKYKELEFIANYNLNIYNSHSINAIHDLNLNKINISPELNLIETNELIQNSNYCFESIVYGKLPVMTNNYCYLGNSNKCYSECKKKCLELDNKYYLKDRMNFLFRVLPDNLNTITTIFNSKTLSIKKDLLNVSSYRIDILDESINEINNIIDTVSSGLRFEGKDFTNGNY